MSGLLPAEKRTFKRDNKELDERESSLEGRAGVYAKKIGYWHRKFKSPGRRSAPDRIFASAFGFVLFVEFKAYGEKATPLQKDEHDEMRANGLIVYVCDNFDDARRLLDKHSLD